MHTFGTVSKDPNVDLVLGPYAELFARALHWTFRELYIREREWTEVKRDVLTSFCARLYGRAVS